MGDWQGESAWILYPSDSEESSDESIPVARTPPLVINLKQSLNRNLKQANSVMSTRNSMMKSLPLVLSTAAWLTMASLPITADAASTPPGSDLAIWLKADAGVTLGSGNTVTAWADQAAATDNSGTALGDPELAQAIFANGPHPVIRFSGNDGFDLLNAASLEVANLSVYVVGSVNSSVASEIFIGHFKPTFGWALGISDGTPGRVKWFTSPPQSLEPVGGSLGNNVPTILTGTYQGGTKTLYVNGTAAGSVSGLTLDYGGGGGNLTVGYLGCCGGIQKLQGDIAEILVYSSVSEDQRVEVEAYLKQKYVDPRPPGDGLRLWLRADEGVVTSDGTAITSWEDQAGGVLNNGTPAGTPTLELADFPGGSRPVVRLDGSGSGFILDNVNDLDVPSVSIYVVGSVDNTKTGGTFISNLRQPFGFSLGLSESDAGRGRFYTGTPQNSLESAASDLPDQTPFLLAGTFDDASTVKKLYLGGVEVASVNGVDLNSATENVLAVGFDKGGRNVLTGAIAEILVYSTVSDAQRTAVELYLRNKYFGSGVGPALITGQPETRQVNELDEVSFTVVADGAPPLSYQWRKNGVNIEGATAPVFGISEALRTDAGSYTVRVSNGLGSVISDPAILTVIEDNTAPTIVSVDRDFVSSTTLNVVFSERLRADTANVAGSFQLNGGATVSSAALAGDGKSVVLTTSPLTGGNYTLTVNGVRDRVGNVVTANSQFAFEVLILPIPSRNLRLWLRADAGVASEDGVSVETWADQGGGVLNNATAFGPVKPQIREELFPTGTRPVIRFGEGGNSGFVLENSGDLRPEELSIYIVTSIWEASASKIMIGNYRDVAGWGLGISDGVGGRVKWFTAPPNSMEPVGPPPEGADLVVDTPYLLTATYAKNGDKKLSIDSADFDSTQIGSATGVALSYAADTQLTVGTLQGGRQWLKGSIAEVLVYSTVDAAQRAAVETYLTQKYFGGGSGAPSITFQPQDKQIDEFSLVTFEVAVDGSAPFTYQWFKGNDPISGADRSTYTIQSATRADAGEYSVRIENGLGSAQSRRAVLSLKNLDSSGPTLISSKRSSIDETQVMVSFSEALDPATALAAGNYAINGVGVTAAVDGGDANTVRLTTSPALLAGGSYTLTVNGVKDRAGNLIAANSKVAVQVPSAVTLVPPSADRILWLKADAGVTVADGGAVVVWEDQAGDVPNNGNATGNPKLAEAEFATGLRPVIRFNGGGGFELENPDDVARTELSIYLVGSVNNAVASRIFLANFKPTFGFGLGISDGVAGRVKWFTSTPPNSMEPAAGSLGNHVPVYLASTFGAGGAKSLFVNGELAGSVVDPSLTIDYSGGGTRLTVGDLGPFGQALDGDIAEILVYSTVSEAQRTEVEDYLREKYFGLGKISIAVEGNNVVLSWTAPGATLQEAPTVTGPWSAVAGAASPFRVGANQVARFYRISK